MSRQGMFRFRLYVAGDALNSAQALTNLTALCRAHLRDRHIIEERCLREDPTPLAEIGRNLGISRERVRQLESRGHEKLSSILRSRNAANGTSQEVALQ